VKKSFWIGTLALAALASAWAQANDRWINLGPVPPSQQKQLCIESLCITSLYVDKQSIQYGPGWSSVTLWLKGAYSDGGYSLTKLELEQSGRYRGLANRAINADGSVAYSDDVASPWSHIDPDTLVEALYNATIRDTQTRAAQIQSENDRRIETQRRLQHAGSYLGCLGAAMANSGQTSLPLAFGSAVGQCQ
jgi:hypothetical protein